ncbi:hypothetical protein GI584_18415 [Gracilibacillus salitolerans]|uniref:Uncharacterized protein n=1 Tax=Gracilibacillus salitolerans TaxID=2663022 RepID=A0A5Q2TPE2_9BACI|nr:hypothetical protein [Gracilibacillus salitolerans]QGH35903.1 hypothetical protein GI584_18415 [Gracilibacillus salitolerans]
MNKHLKQELLLLSIVMVIVLVVVLFVWLVFKDSLRPETIVRKSTVEKVNKQEGTITVECVQSKVDDISEFEEGQNVKVGFTIPRSDEDVWNCNKNKIKDVEIME